MGLEGSVSRRSFSNLCRGFQGDPICGRLRGKVEQTPLRRYATDYSPGLDLRGPTPAGFRTTGVVGPTGLGPLWLGQGPGVCAGSSGRSTQSERGRRRSARQRGRPARGDWFRFLPSWRSQERIGASFSAVTLGLFPLSFFSREPYLPELSRKSFRLTNRGLFFFSVGRSFITVLGPINIIIFVSFFAFTFPRLATSPIPSDSRSA